MVFTLVNVKNTRISTFTVRGLWGGRVSGFQGCRASAMQKVSRPLTWIPFCRKISADEGVLAREVLTFWDLSLRGREALMPGPALNPKPQTLDPKP